MKASLKLQEQGKPPLLRAKVPVAVLSLPLVSSASASGADDLSFHLRTALAAGPSLKVSYHPSPFGSPSRLPPFSVTLKSGVGLWGSPNGSPLHISARLALPDDLRRSPSFSIQFKPRFGDFALRKTAFTAASPSAPLPNNTGDPNKENGGAVYHPMPVPAPPRERSPLEDLVASGVAAVAAKTTIPLGRSAEVSLRWAVNLPWPGTWRVRLPYLTVDKISVVAAESGKEKKAEAEKKDDGNNGGSDYEAMKGALFFMNMEVEELRKQTLSIKESMEELKFTVFNGRKDLRAGGGAGGKGEDKDSREPVGAAGTSNHVSARSSSS